MLERYTNNPIIEPGDLFWANRKIYNCAVVRDSEKFKMVFRAVGEDWVSRLGYAESSDGINFEVHPEPVLVASSPGEQGGVEDPRLVKLNNEFWLTYTCYAGAGRNARLALARSKDLMSWKKLGPIFPEWDEGRWGKLEVKEEMPNWSKSGAIFPEKINGQYLMLFGDDLIWPAWSDDLISWQPEHTVVVGPREGEKLFDSGYVEMGPPPIKIERGWAVFYHGIQRVADEPKKPRVYSLGVVILDLNDPTKIVYRSQDPILVPSRDYEICGMLDIVPGQYETIKNISLEEVKQLAADNNLPLAVFCCGAVFYQEEFWIYYSASDKVICLAKAKLGDIIKI